jgi:TolB protein
MGGLVAFETRAGIHLIHPDGSELRRLPGTQRFDQNPSWSPDGRRLVFWTNAAATGQIYVANADGSGRRLLTPYPQAQNDPAPTDQFPTWSPTGSLISFERVAVEGVEDSWSIWVMRPDGSGRRRITPRGTFAHSPSWSPDGKRIVYTSETSLGVVDLAGRGRPLQTLSEVSDWAPEWSPDGSRIAIASTVDHPKGEIYILHLPSGRRTRLTNNEVADVDPMWSPDGESIVFTTGRTGFYELYTMRTDGSEQRRVTRIPNGHACCGDWREQP